MTSLHSREYGVAELVVALILAELVVFTSCKVPRPYHLGV